ncbi:unnamed protein product, partial [Laminaria digitata]
SVVLLLNSGNPAPLYTWRLPDDVPVCLSLLVGTAAAYGGREGVLCLTRKGDLILLSVASGGGDGKDLSPQSKAVITIGGSGDGLGVVRIKKGASAPAVQLSTAAKR